MSDVKEVKVSGEALRKPRGRRNTTRKNRQDGGDNSGALQQLASTRVYRGGDNSGALMQLASTRTMRGGDNSGALMQVVAQKTPPVDSQAYGQQFTAQVKDILAANFGPNKIQQGGDNTGGLLQVASVPQMGGPMNTQRFQDEFRSQVANVLQNNFGPDKSQQFGGKKHKGGDGIAGTISLSASRAPTLPGAPPPTPVISGISPEQPAPVGGGRVVLAPPKRKTRIALKAKKMRGGSEAVAGTAEKPPTMLGGTRKARKIHLRVKGVTSRLAKAKKARKTAMNTPISDVRSRLESAGIIKKGSKAPEGMLRNMYADLLITKKGL
jgi:hypothetical protein